MMLIQHFKLLILKCRREYRSPTRSLSLYFLRARYLLKLVFRKFYRKQALYVPLVVYDLRVSVISYDILTTLFLHELECQRLGAEKFDLIIFNPEHSSSLLNMGSAYSSVISSEKRAQRIANLLLPIAIRYKACASAKVEVCAHKLESSIKLRNVVLPYGYNGKNFLALRQQSLYRSLAKNPSYEGVLSLNSDQERCRNWIKSNSKYDSYVTFTLRDYGHQPTRNLTLDEVRFSFDFLLQRGVQPVIIPDFDGGVQTHDSGDCIICHDASGDFGFRLALYEGAVTNVASPSGPLMAIVLSRRSYGVKVKSFHEDSAQQLSGHGSTIYRKYFGVSIGDQPLSPSSVHIVWNSDFKDELIKYLSLRIDASTYT